MNIRPAQSDDIPRLVELWIELMDFHIQFDASYKRSDDAVDNWVKYLKERLSDDKCQFFVAEIEDKLVAYVGAGVKEYPPVFEVLEYGFIEEIAVTREYRQRGIGRALAIAAEDWLRASGVTQIDVKVDVGNTASMALFTGRKFTARTQTLTRKA